MWSQIITKTPLWVFGLFFALVVLGSLQMRARKISARRVFILPIVFLLLSAAGVVSAFGLSSIPLLAFAVGYILAITLVVSSPREPNASYNKALQEFNVAGSSVPLVLMMSIFALKYFVGVSTAMHTSFALSDLFPLTISALYGGFSGIFAGRALKLYRLTRVI